jgi:hypothetical protein
MPIDPALLAKAYRAPQDLRFEEACALAGQLGFEEVRRTGSHRIYRHARGRRIREQFPLPLNLQCGKNGKAKVYQVRQMLAIAELAGNIPVRS